MEEYTGYQATNFIFPDNFQLPRLCETCPLRRFAQPRIAQAAIHHFNIRGVYHTNWAGGITGVLLFHDGADPGCEPVVLGELPIVSPFSAEHEMPLSRGLGDMHRRFDMCKTPEERRSFGGRLLGRKARMYCGTGFQQVSDYNYWLQGSGIGQAVDYTPDELLRELVVSEEVHSFRRA
jgi:hypothetical protein